MLLWVASGDAPLGPTAREAIEDSRRVVFVSAASAWEIAIKAGLGKLTAPTDYLAMLAHYRFTPLDVTSEHALAVRDLPPLHRDPFDRLLVAQASVESLTIVSNDEAVAQYGTSTMPARW